MANVIKNLIITLVGLGVALISLKQFFNLTKTNMVITIIITIITSQTLKRERVKYQILENIIGSFLTALAACLVLCFLKV